MVLDGIDIKVTNDLRSTKAAFIKAYSAKVTAEQEGGDGEMWTNSKKYSMGVEAWMNSSLRSVLNSSKNKGFTSIPASLILLG